MPDTGSVVRTTLCITALLYARPGHTQQPINPPARQGPATPRRLPGYCEGEDCNFGYPVVACRRLPLRSGDSTPARVVGYLPQGDTATVTTGNVWVLRPGVIVLRRDTLLSTDDGRPREDTLRLSRGDTVYLLEYRALGAWTWWHRGRLSGGIEFWNGPAQRYFARGRESLPALSLSEPVEEYWLRLRGSSGLTGWWRDVRAESPLARIEQDEHCP